MTDDGCRKLRKSDVVYTFSAHKVRLNISELCYCRYFGDFIFSFRPDNPE